MKAYEIKDIEVVESAIVTTISFTGNREERQDLREKLILICGSSGFKFLSYMDEGLVKQMGTLRFWKKRI